jgi:ribosomal protein L18E
MDRNQEIWGVALWVEKHHPDDGAQFIAKQVARLKSQGDSDGVELWRVVAERLAQLRAGHGRA